MVRYLFYKESVSKYKNTVSTRPVEQSKVESLHFSLGGLVWVIMRLRPQPAVHKYFHYSYEKMTLVFTQIL